MEEKVSDKEKPEKKVEIVRDFLNFVVNILIAKG